MKPDELSKQVQLSLDYKVSVLATDGHLLISKPDGSVDVCFLQLNKQNEPVADVVAAVRFKSADSLEELKKSIDEHLRKRTQKKNRPAFRKKATFFSKKQARSFRVAYNRNKLKESCERSIQRNQKCIQKSC